MESTKRIEGQKTTFRVKSIVAIIPRTSGGKKLSITQSLQCFCDELLLAFVFNPVKELVPA
jgi:hypothetical protein